MNKEKIAIYGEQYGSLRLEAIGFQTFEEAEQYLLDHKSPMAILGNWKFVTYKPGQKLPVEREME